MTISGEFAAEHRQQRQVAVTVRLKQEAVIAADRRGGGFAVINQRPHPRVRPDYIGQRNLVSRIAIDCTTQVIDLGNGNRCRIIHFGDFHISGAHQREIALERNQKTDAAIVVLQRAGVVALIEPGHHNVTATHQSQSCFRASAGQSLCHPRHPGPRNVDDGARLQLAAPRRIFQRRDPVAAAAAGCDEAAARKQLSTMRHRRTHIRQRQSCVVDTDIRVNETCAIFGFEHAATRVDTKINAMRSRQTAATAQTAQRVIEEQPRTDHPLRPHAGALRQHETSRMGQMRRDAQQHFALRQRFGNEAEGELFEITQSAMHQLAAR